MEIWLYLAAGGVFLLAIAVYVFFMIVWPEWVGITGKVALEAERSHRGGAESQFDLIDSLQKPSRAKTDETPRD